MRIQSGLESKESFKDIAKAIGKDCTSVTDPNSGLQFCRLFYCDPCQIRQKGSCENNHGFIRRVMLKGKSMNNYDQEKINLIMSHINSSYMRDELEGRSPYDVFSFKYGPNILEKLGIRRIDPYEVILKPSLLD